MLFYFRGRSFSFKFLFNTFLKSKRVSFSRKKFINVVTRLASIRKGTNKPLLPEIGIQCPLDLRKIFGVAKKFLKSRSFFLISNATKSLNTYINNR